MADDPLPILQLENLDVDLRRYSYAPADFSSFFPLIDCHDWNYEWQVEVDGEVFSEIGKRCRSPLWVVIERLKLLGFPESVGHRLYEDIRSDSENRPPVFRRLPIPPYPPFHVLAEGVVSIDPLSVEEGHPRKGPNSPWRKAAICAAEADGGGFPSKHTPNPVDWYQQRIEGLDTATVLHMFARNPANLMLPVTWWAYNEVTYGELDENDYADEIGAKAEDRIMIVTEGKSDTRIIAKALAMFRPHLQDFFNFVDMSDNYPFTGVGNLTNFYMGLNKIGIQNNVIVLFDNDAEGVAKFLDAAKLPTLQNIRIMKLPDLRSLTKFHTVGPTGEHYADINGRASSIECFLDLHWQTSHEPSVRWTSYLKAVRDYQGELIDKTRYMKLFLALTELQADAYGSGKISELLDRVSAEAADMAVQRLMKGY